MDTLTHALSGALLARLVLVRHDTHAAPIGAAPPGAPPALKLWQGVLVGALAGAFPDIDVVARLAGDVAYLTQHRGLTHALPMLPLWAALLAWVLQRCFAGTRGRPGAWRQLAVLCAGGIGIHIAGDWITQFGTMLLQPFSDRRFGLGAMFIIDLAFSGLLLAGLLLAALFPRRRWPAALGLAAATAWVGLAWTGQQEALAVAQRQAQAMGITPQQVVVMPRPASPFNWTVSLFDGSSYHVAHVNTRRSQPLDPDAPALFPPAFVRRYSAPYLPVPLAAWERVPRWGPPGTPAWVQQAWARPEFGFFRWFAQTPALLQATDAGGQRCAVFRDLRFDFPGRAESPFRLRAVPARGGHPAGAVVQAGGRRRRPLGPAAPPA